MMGRRNEILTILLILSEVLGAETFATGTARRGIWILHLEAAVLQRIHVIQFASGDVERAFGIHHHAHTGGFDQKIAVGRSVL